MDSHRYTMRIIKLVKEGANLLKGVTKVIELGASMIRLAPSVIPTKNLADRKCRKSVWLPVLTISL